MKSISVALLVAFAFTALSACNRDTPAGAGSGGPAEKAGREADRAMGQAGKAVEQAGKDMQDAAKGKK
jgi:predicted small secreted protein